MDTRLPDEITIHLVNKEKISELHAQYFSDPTPTDCISFPLNSIDDTSCGYLHLGEVFVCPEVAIEYATSHNIPPLQECILYTIHGILHLLGYDDIDEEDRQKMRKAEERCMKAFFDCTKDSSFCLIQ